jgi:cytochrome c553
MKAVSLRLALHTAILAIALSAAGHAEDKVTATVSRQDLQAKIEYCKTCHGVSGQGYRGFYPMPRLAGQQAEYIENQLQAFIERRRQNNVMFNVAHVLNPAMLKALATYFTDLSPKPLGGAPRELVAAGKKTLNQWNSATQLSAKRCHIKQKNALNITLPPDAAPAANFVNSVWRRKWASCGPPHGFA